MSNYFNIHSNRCTLGLQIIVETMIINFWWFWHAAWSYLEPSTIIKNDKNCQEVKNSLFANLHTSKFEWLTKDCNSFNRKSKVYWYDMEEINVKYPVITYKCKVKYVYEFDGIPPSTIIRTLHYYLFLTICPPSTIIWVSTIIWSPRVRGLDQGG